jgi:hypothetical protein
MKRSKLFLGISAGVLGVVAFTAAKVASFSGLRNAYYHQSGKSACTVLASLQFYSIPAIGAGQATAGSLSSPADAPLYTFNNGGNCRIQGKLYKTGATD